MKVTFKPSIKKRIKLQCTHPELLNYIKRKFSIKNPNAKYMKWGQDLVSCISPSYTFHHGLAFDVIRAVKEFDSTIEVDVSQIQEILLPMSIRDPEIQQPDNTKYTYYDYQEDSIRLGLKFGRGIFELATSAGKSLIIYGLIKNYWENIGSKKVLILVPGKQLVSQMAGDLEDYGMSTDKICRYTAEGDREYTGQNVIISNTAWILLHGKKLPEIDIVIVDECLRKGTLITTKNSQIPIEDICVGDEVLSYNVETNIWEFKTVLQTFKNLHKSQSYDYFLQIEMEDGRIIEVTPNHKIYTTNRGYVRADELNEEDDIQLSNLKPCDYIINIAKRK